MDPAGTIFSARPLSAKVSMSPSIAHTTLSRVIERASRSRLVESISFLSNVVINKQQSKPCST